MSESRPPIEFAIHRRPDQLGGRGDELLITGHIGGRWYRKEARLSVTGPVHAEVLEQQWNLLAKAKLTELIHDLLYREVCVPRGISWETYIAELATRKEAP